MPFSYRITGPHSVVRLDPLVHQFGDFVLCTDLENAKLDLVWETTCERAWKQVHDSAKVLNRLHNTQILEDKANMAFLQLRMHTPTLDTIIGPNADSVVQWCLDRWTTAMIQPQATQRSNEECNQFQTMNLSAESFLSEPHQWSIPFQDMSDENISAMDLTDWWALKASKGNGGKDVWVINRHNYASVLAAVPPKDEYILQRYIPRPLLWHGKKFHFRCYSLLRANMTAYLYQKGFIICAGSSYFPMSSSPSWMQPDLSQHLTNLSINKASPGHPGLVPCLMTQECSSIFEKVSAMWKDVAQAAAPFMREQRSPHHFEFFGLDVIVDHEGECWLIEVNRVPGLETSNNRCKPQEETMFDEMMTSTLRMVLKPLRDLAKADDAAVEVDDDCERCWGEVSENTYLQDHRVTSTGDAGSKRNKSGTLNELPANGCLGGGSLCESDCEGWWTQVGVADSDSQTSSTATFKNLFNWKAFTSKNKGSLFI